MTGAGNGAVPDASSYVLDVWSGFRNWPDVSGVMLLRWHHDGRIYDTQVFGRVSPAFATEAEAMRGLEDGLHLNNGVMCQRLGMSLPSGGGVGLAARTRASTLEAVAERFGTLLDEMLLSLAQSHDRQLEIALAQFDSTFALFPDKARFLSTGPGVVLSVNPLAETGLQKLGVRIDAGNRVHADAPIARELVRCCDLAANAEQLHVLRDVDAQIVATCLVKPVRGVCALTGAALPLAVQVELRRL